MPRGALPESKGVTAANKRYTSALLRLCKLLDVQQHTIATQLGVSDGLVTRWAKGEKTIQSQHATLLSFLLRAAIEEVSERDEEEPKQAIKWQNEFCGALEEFTDAIGETESAYIHWLLAFARPLIETMPKKMEGYAIFPPLRAEILHTLNLITELLGSIRDRPETSRSPEAHPRLEQMKKLWSDASPEERNAMRNWVLKGESGSPISFAEYLWAQDKLSHSGRQNFPQLLEKMAQWFEFD